MKLATFFSTAMVGVAVLSGATGARAQQVKPTCTADTRACMITAATAYIDALVNHDASKVPFAPTIRRTEQGHVTGTSETQIREHTKTQPDMDGRANTRFFVDTATKNVVVYYLLKVPGTKADPNRKSVTDGRPNLGPSTAHIAERFKVEKGLITEIEALFMIETGTKDGTSNWPDQ